MTIMPTVQIQGMQAEKLYLLACLRLYPYATHSSFCTGNMYLRLHSHFQRLVRRNHGASTSATSAPHVTTPCACTAAHIPITPLRAEAGFITGAVAAHAGLPAFHLRTGASEAVCKHIGRGHGEGGTQLPHIMCCSS